MNTDKTDLQIMQITQITTTRGEAQRSEISGGLDFSLSYLPGNLRNLSPASYRGKRPLYSLDTRKALTMSAFWKLPPNVFSLSSQKL